MKIEEAKMDMYANSNFANSSLNSPKGLVFISKNKSPSKPTSTVNSNNRMSKSPSKFLISLNQGKLDKEREN